MTAAVSPLPISLQLVDSTAEARKRRREILVSQRNTTAEALAKPVQTALPDPQIKRRKLDHDKVAQKTVSKPAKKPQMKYDPDVPMSKEEAAAWRREQRRKRNRESAAASRQRQRDRITELEVEVDDWQSKVEAILDKIKKLEEVTGKKAPVSSLPALSKPVEEATLKFVSPPASPRNSPLQSPVASPVASSSIVEVARVTPSKEKRVFNASVESEQELSDKMVSRQAAS